MSVEAANALAARWAARLDSTVDGPGSVFSAACAYPLLALLAQAATGVTREELAAVAPTPLALPDSPAIAAALGVWVSERLPLAEWWTANVPASLHGRLTGDAAADKGALDAWAAEQTGGLIPTMPVQLSETIVMVLASALSVRTGWTRPFEDGPLRVQEGPWAGDRLLAGLGRTSSDLDAVLLAQTPAGPLTLFTAEGTGDVDVVLALGEPDRPATAVLPAAIAALDPAAPAAVPGSALPDGLPGPGIEVGTVPATRDEPRLAVSTVRFTVRSEHDLLAEPALFGLSAAADPRLDEHRFPGISPRPLLVDQAKQAALATFSATGFEAAAVTALGMRLVSMPATPYEVRSVRVAFHRPFGFVAVHRPTGLVLVAGWVAEPEDYREA